jgi:hypothetical protein
MFISLWLMFFECCALVLLLSGQIDELINQGYSRGLARALSENAATYDFRFWVIDNRCVYVRVVSNTMGICIILNFILNMYHHTFSVDQCESEMVTGWYPPARVTDQ